MKKITLLLVLLIGISATSQTVYQLDHIHRYIWQDGDWFRNTEEYYEYDNGGTKETDVLNKISVDGTNFQDNFRHTKTYNSNNSILTDFKELWNGATWVEDTKITKTYDGSNRTLTDLKEKNNGFGLENDTKSDYTYNDVENKSEILFYDKYEAGAWVLYRHTFDALTPTGSEREIWVRNFISGVVERENKTITTIINDVYMGEIQQDWDTDISDWVNIEKLEVSYTMDGQWDKFEYYNWDTDMNDWEPEPYQRTSYIRDDPTYDLITLVEDNDAGVWVNSARILSIRDGNNLLSSTTDIWDDLGEVWETFSITTYDYDANNNNSKITTKRDIGMGLVNAFRTDLFWEEGATFSVTFNSLIGVHPYPNPTTDVINIKFKSPLANTSEVKLFDIQGKLIHVTTISHGNSTLQVPIMYQPNGIYMLHVKAGEATEVYKIVKDTN